MTQKAETLSSKFWPELGVILAAGFGSRIQEDPREIKSKPLIELGGLYLIERALLNLKVAGIKKARIVVGAYKDEVIKSVKKLKSLNGLEIEFVDCVEFEKGNGASLAYGAKGISGSFLVLMSDHVMSPNLVSEFVKQVLLRDPTRLYLATDPNIPNVFDLDDATKVRVEEGRILDIGKNLKTYNEVDTGLFYFPCGSAPRVFECFESGKHSVSEIVDTIQKEFSFCAQNIHPQSFWQDVDTPQMAREAERRLLGSLVSQEDGWISRLFNRPISTRLSLWMSRRKWHPNFITSCVLLLSLLASVVASMGDFLSVAVAGILFQIASIVDGCDGEVARMTYTQSETGARFEKIVHYLRYGGFFLGLGLGLWHGELPGFYLLGTFIFVLFLVHLVLRVFRFEKLSQQSFSPEWVAEELRHFQGEKTSAWLSWVLQLRNLVKQDFVAFMAMIFCLMGQSGLLFWLTCVGLVVVTLMVDWALARQGNHWIKGAVHSVLGTETSFIFFALGAGLMIWIYARFSLVKIFENQIHDPKLLPFLFVLPLIWYALNSGALMLLHQKGVRFLQFFQSQIVGEALNALVPVAGMMVEPVKAKYLARWMNSEQAEKSTFEDRLLHIVAGLFFASALALFILLEAPLFVGARLGLPLFFVVSVSLGFLALRVLSNSTAGEAMMNFLVQLRIVDQKKALHLNHPVRLQAALVAKILGRAMSLLEIALLLKIVGINPEISIVVWIMAGISFSSLLGFWIPQGLGIHEVAVLLVFYQLKMPLEAGLLLCALRRIRMLVFSVLGVGFLLQQFSFEKVKNKAENFG